jgi:hypothetical protein
MDYAHKVRRLQSSNHLPWGAKMLPLDLQDALIRPGLVMKWFPSWWCCGGLIGVESNSTSVLRSGLASVPCSGSVWGEGVGAEHAVVRVGQNHVHHHPS